MTRDDNKITEPDPDFYTFEPEPMPTYELAPDGVDTDLAELEKWQKRQAKILDVWRQNQKDALDSHLATINSRRQRALEWRRDAVGWVIAVIVALGLITGVWFGGNYLNRASQTDYYNAWKSWSDQCTTAGGRAAGDYSDKSTHTCVFPNGAQLARKVSS